MIENNVLFAALITLFAGLSTGIGSTLAFFSKRTNVSFLTFSLGFSAGVMIYVSFVEIFFEGMEALQEAVGRIPGAWITVLAFFGGILLIGLIDRLVPSFENPHEIRDAKEMGESQASKKKQHDQQLMRTGKFTALAIAIHNFPEGIATFFAALIDPALGISVGIAVAIHNIPEGIAVSVPIYHATGNRKVAFIYSFLSGLAEPAGGLIGYFILAPFMNEAVLGVTFAAVAGIMVFISLDELLPTAEKYGRHHLAIYGLIAGMAVMAVSLLLLM